MRLALALVVLPLFLQDEKQLPSIALSEYAERRGRLADKLSDGVVVMEAEKLGVGMNAIDANTPKYDFHYLTGHHAAGDLLVIIASEKDRPTFLFTSEDAAKVKERTGLANVLARDRFDGFVKEVLSATKVIYTRVRREAKKSIEDGAPESEVKGADARGRNPIVSELARLRMVKSAAEIKMMKKAADATNIAHLAAMRACKGGMNEGELQKIIEDTFKKEHCDGLGFPSIVGSGKNGTILHYDTNNQEMPKGTLVVCDIGASYRGYVTDITRTLPTDGVYADDQKKAYQCVLDAQKAAEAILKPGVSFQELESAAAAVFKERELTKWSYAHARDFSVRHGLSHYVGMAVHDSGTYGKIPEGAVITIEPGYYDKDAGWGIRIEDIYLVTKDGCERLSAAAPREVEEIEKVMKR